MIVTDDGENRYGDEPTLIVVVGPLVGQVDARVAVFVGVGVGLGLVVARGVELVVRVGVADVVAAAVCCFLRGTEADGLGAALLLTVGDDVEIGGDCESCTSTLADPLLQAVTASMKPSATATFPL